MPKKSRVAPWPGLLFTLAAVIVICGLIFRRDWAAHEHLLPTIGATIAFLLVGIYMMFRGDDYGGWWGRPLIVIVLADLAVIGWWALFTIRKIDGGIPFLPPAWNLAIFRIVVGLGLLILTGFAISNIISLFRRRTPPSR